MRPPTRTRPVPTHNAAADDVREPGRRDGRADGAPLSEPPVPTRATLAGVFVGGCIGTALRAGVTFVLDDRAHGTWAATLAVNVLGALLLGVVAAWSRGRSATPWWLRPTIVVGMLGAFTTYSALAVDAVHLGRGLGPAALVGYPVLSLILGLAAVSVGVRLGARGRTARDDAPC